MNLAFMPGNAVLLFYRILKHGSVDFCVLSGEYEMYHIDLSLLWVSLWNIPYYVQCLIYENNNRKKNRKSLRICMPVFV